MRTVYANANWRLDREERSGMYSLLTVTMISFVSAVDMPGQTAKCARFIQGDIIDEGPRRGSHRADRNRAVPHPGGRWGRCPCSGPGHGAGRRAAARGGPA